MSETRIIKETETTASPREEFHWLSRISDVSGLGIILFSQDMGLEFINKLALEFFEIPADHFERNVSYSKLIMHMAKRGDFGAGDSQSFGNLNLPCLPAGDYWFVKNMTRTIVFY